MQTLDRPALMRKSIPDLVSMMRLLGADSPANESKESLINRILLFQPQKWKDQPKIKHDPIEPVTEQQLKVALNKHIEHGLELTVDGGCWFIAFEGRKDSGSLAMPLAVIERTAGYLMRGK